MSSTTLSGSGCLLSQLSADLLSHSLSFINNDEIANTITSLENATSSSVEVMKSTLRVWKRLRQADQAKVNRRWKTLSKLEDDDEDIARKTGKEFYHARHVARQITQQSEILYNYTISPVPFFCPEPKNVQDRRDLEQQLSPSCWPSDSLTEVFLNLTDRDSGEALWEGYRPIQTLSTRSFRVSLNLPALLHDLVNSDTVTALNMYYTWITMSRDNTVVNPQNRDFDIVQNYTEEDIVSTISTSKRQQLGSLMRKFQVTIMHGDQVVVATGGFQTALSSSRGQFHDRKTQIDAAAPDEEMTTEDQPFTAVSTFLAFHQNEIQQYDRLDIQVTRS